jgi:hypothetical protein
MEFTLKLLKKSLLRHTEPSWIHEKVSETTENEVEVSN